MRAAALASIALLAASGLALAQDRQEVIPPRAVYWVSVKTQAGMMGFSGGMDAMRAMMNGGQGASNASMILQLGSQDAPQRGAPQETHTLPASARIGPALRLETPRREPGGQREQTDEFRRPEGRLLLFFGCGERARAGQPVVIDFARVAAGEMPAGLQSRVRAARTPNPPSADRWTTYGDWPHGRTREQTILPAGASLVGEHVLRGNYAPEIRFSLGQATDVMAPVTFTQNAPNPSGSVTFAWNAVPTATGYYAMAMGRGASENEMVFWSSSEAQTFDGGSLDFIPPGEVERLVRERVVMAPATRQCTVPREAVAAIRAGGEENPGMIFFNAFGPEANFVYPERPADRAVPWRQEWFVKVRFQSIAMEMLGQSMASMMGAANGAPGAAPLTQEEICRQQAEQRAQQRGSVGEAIGAATGIPGAGMLGRALGRRNQPAQPADPNCPPAQ